MTRLHAPARPGLFARIAFFITRRRFGRVPATFALVAHHPAILAATGGYELNLQRAHTVPARLKYLAEVHVARRVGCAFCIDFGSWIARSQGALDETDLRGLADGHLSTHFSPLERQVLAYAEGMTATPADIDDVLFSALHQTLGAPGMVELTAAIAWENYRARFNHAVGGESEGFSAGAYCPVASRPLPEHAASPSQEAG